MHKGLGFMFWIKASNGFIWVSLCKGGSERDKASIVMENCNIVWWCTDTCKRWCWYSVCTWLLFAISLYRNRPSGWTSPSESSSWLSGTELPRNGSKKNQETLTRSDYSYTHTHTHTHTHGIHVWTHACQHAHITYVASHTFTKMYSVRVYSLVPRFSMHMTKIGTVWSTRWCNDYV